MSENEKIIAENEVQNESVNNYNPLNALQSIRGMLTEDEELVFMNIMYSSSASIRLSNFGLSRKEVEKQLNISGDEEKFHSFITRVNQAVARYFRLIYDERRDQVICMMKVPSKSAKTTLNKESISILLYIFYQQEVLQHEFTTLDQLLDAFGHETTKANSKILANIDPLKKIGALEDYDTTSQEKAYQLTAIGVNMFSDSFLRRTVEFSQSTQLNKEEVLKFFRRYNYVQKGEEE